MSFLQGLNTATPENIKVTDKVGFTPIETGIYSVKIKTAYAMQSAYGVRANFEFELEDGRTHSQGYTILNENGQYIYKTQEGEDKFLSGYVSANSIAFLALNGKNLRELATQKRTIAIRNFETSQDEPTEVEVFTDLIGKTVNLGLVREARFKRVKDAAGEWSEDTSKAQVRTTVHTAFHSVKNITYAEAYTALRNNTAPEAKFIDVWKGKFKDGVVSDYTNGAYLTASASGQASTASASAASAESSEAVKAAAAAASSGSVWG